MTDASALLALAARCEAATGADRMLGREVLLACGQGYVSPLYRWLDPTASLDAAMTLADAEWQIGVGWHCDDREGWAAVGPNALAGFPLGEGKAKDLNAVPAQARALTAAALRARASEGGGAS